MYLLHDKSSCGKTYMTMIINWPWSMTMSVLKTMGKCFALNQWEFPGLYKILRSWLVKTNLHHLV